MLMYITFTLIKFQELFYQPNFIIIHPVRHLIGANDNKHSPFNNQK